MCWPRGSARDSAACTHDDQPQPQPQCQRSYGGWSLAPTVAPFKPFRMAGASRYCRRVKRIRTTDTLLLVGDAVADSVAEYAVLVARVKTADRVKLNAYDEGGDHVQATLVLSSAAAILIESTNSNLPDPDNSEAEQYIRSRIDRWDNGTERP